MKKQSKSLEWYYKHREEQIKKNREWKIKNRERMLKQKKEYHQRNRNKILKRKADYRIKNKEKIMLYRRKEEVKEKAKLRMRDIREKTNRKYDKEYYEKNREKRLAYHKIHSQIPEVKARRRELERIRNKENPRSNRSLPLELQFEMNKIRKLQGNKCQWQGCNITFKQGRIDVHHIFPRNEYPELEMIPKYMICYCAAHHSYWHKMRGDAYYKMIEPEYEERLNV